MSIRFNEVVHLLKAQGLTYRGGFYPESDDGVPESLGEPSQTLILIGHAGSSLWPQFSHWLKTQIDHTEPLDSWSVEVLESMAAEIKATALFPFRGPPYWPFIRWAERADHLWVSSIGLLIHPVYGLWHAYRGALIFPYRLPLPKKTSPETTTFPCSTCDQRPCLTVCPVGAMQEEGYALETCINYLAEHSDGECMQRGCLARRACPVGTKYSYAPEQAQFHMRAFLRNQLRPR